MSISTMLCEFDKAQYLTGEPIHIHVEKACNDVRVKVYRLEKEVTCKVRVQENGLSLEGLPAGSYGVELNSGESAWEGAFDIVNNRSQVIRYGFLTDFSSDDEKVRNVEWIRNLHLNAVQFYDWMYRHDQLLPEEEQYEDPLGRPLSLRTVKSKIAECKRYGIRPFAYGAVYAGTEKTYTRHPHWAMYTMEGKPMTFAGWLYYMNIAGDGWPDHLIEEYRKAAEFGFSGIHMDTYGFPKKVWDADGHPLELGNAFAKLIDRAAVTLREADPDGGVIFNAVNNWPMENVAKASQDAVYIEVWPPHDTYYDLYELIKKARDCSGKNVVLAAYMKPFQSGDTEAAERAFRLTWAVISASGGTQLVLGENKGILRDSYYVNYATLREKFCQTVQKYCDFLVRYADLLYNDNGVDVTKTASGGINEDICFRSDNCTFSTDGKGGTVWTIIREDESKTVIHLINLTGNNNLWNEQKNEPGRTNTIDISLRLDRHICGIYWASPDGPSIKASELAYTYRETGQGRIYETTVPDVAYWTAVWVRLEG